jgi:hypothetical protein
MSLTCPYCSYIHKDFDGFDYEEVDVIHDYTCEKCNKVFGFETEYEPYYSERELPCANGQDHRWLATDRPEIPYIHRRCEYCDTRENIKKELAGN